MTEATAENIAPAETRKRRRFVDRLSPLNQRRWANFRANRRGYYALWIFLALFGISLVAEFLANSRPLVLSYQGGLYFPVLFDYLPTEFGGDPGGKLWDYRGEPSLQCLIRTGGAQACLEAASDHAYANIEANAALDPATKDKTGWILWPLNSWGPRLTVDGLQHPSAPSADNWLGTDTTGRDIFARTLYAFRISVSFGMIVTIAAAIVGIFAGAVMGYFGGWVDLVFQRILEIWSSAPTLFVIMIFASALTINFWVLAGITIFFGWVSFVGVVRAEFLRTRNFEYVRAAQALGVSDWRIIFRHVLPNAMVATLTLLPFALTGTIGALATLDFLGFGLGSETPSFGELALQAKGNLQAPWIGFTAFVSLTIMLLLLVFIFEAVRDAFDPRKTFA